MMITIVLMLIGWEHVTDLQCT